ncbi:MAG: IS110 family transposase [Kiritimatiellae bacterium]|nr:IS110 family transposase [Kiritimatiellia bacterium]MCO5068463.1 IS110 family transposase [Kiritimatiellia bacterium]
MSGTAESAAVLYMAMELGNRTWKLAFCTGEQNPRQVNVMAGETASLLRAISQAKTKFALPPDTPVKSCYEAGRDGFWIHRFLETNGVNNLVVDASSIEVNRKMRRVKTDRLDADHLVRMLMRYWRGEKTVWGVARVPTVDQEDERRLQREMIRLKRERARHYHRIKALLCLHGLRFGRGWKHFEKFIEKVRQWDGSCLPERLLAELSREYRRIQLLDEQIEGLEKSQAERLKCPVTTAQKKAAKLNRLRGVGPVSSTLLSGELFAWRHFNNRRELGALSGLTASPYASGQYNHNQGISKAGNRWIRALMIEAAWNWLQYQPQSALSEWYRTRFGFGNKRQRKIGIVALARKLLVALWKYVERDELPAGAILAVP